MLCQRVPSCAPSREEKAWIALGLNRTAGHRRARCRIDSLRSLLGVQNAPLFRPRSGRTIYYYHFLWMHFLKSFCAFNKNPIVRWDPGVIFYALFVFWIDTMNRYLRSKSYIGRISISCCFVTFFVFSL